MQIIEILLRFSLTILGTGPDGRITKKDVESFVPPKVAPVSRLEISKNGYFVIVMEMLCRNAILYGTVISELVELRRSVGYGGC